jgi:hypothetical protein
MTKINRGVLQAALLSQAALLVAAVGLLLEPQMNNSWASAAPQGGSQGSGFLGA